MAGDRGRLGLDIAGGRLGMDIARGMMVGVSEIHDSAFLGAMGHVPSTT